MLGHGRPNSFGGRTWSLLPKPALVARYVCAMLALCAGAARNDLARGEELDLRLRIAWGGGEPRGWKGTIAVVDGALGELRLLGQEIDEHAGVWLDSGQIHVAQRRPRMLSTLDVSVRAPSPDARLRFDLMHFDDQERSLAVEVPLGSLDESVTRPIDERQNRCFLQRAPGDALRVELTREHLVFAPGETLSALLQPHEIGVPPGTKVRVQVALQEARDGREWNAWDFDRVVDDQGRVPPIPFETPAPTAEGAYELAISVAGKRRAWKGPLAERRLQFVVVSPQPPRAGPAPASFDRLIGEVDLAALLQKKRGANLPLVPHFKRQPVGLGDARLSSHPLGALAQLAPRPLDGDLPWEAYPLPAVEPGRPHVLEVQYPSDLPQTLGLGVVEVNAAGSVAAPSVDVALHVGDEARRSTAEWQTQRVLFWPRSRSPVALLTNPRGDAPAAAGKLRLYAGPPHLPNLRDSISAGIALSDTPTTRQILAYLDRPLLPENFSGADAVDAATHQSIEDWTTFLEAGQRLVEYLGYSGHTGVMLSVAADGGALYPSRVLAPTPRYDGGPLSSVGHDPLPKDVVELLAQLCDRQQLTFVPALDLTAAVPRLEAARRADPASGVEWIGPDGAPLAPSEGGPRYNILHPEVRAVVLDAVRELALRYGRHASLGGVAIQLSPQSFALLAPPQFGVDDATVARFEATTGIRLDSGFDSTRFAQRAKALTGPHRQAWESWRVGQVTELWQALATEIATYTPRGKLYLAGAGIFDRSDVQRELLPTLPRKGSLDVILRRLGVDLEVLDQDPRIIVPRPDRRTLPTTIAAQAIETQAQQSASLDRLSQASTWPAAFSFSPPRIAPVASFDARGPFKQGRLRLATQVVAADRSRFQPLAHALATLDCQTWVQGGLQIPLLDDAEGRALAAVVQQLPAARFEPVDQPTQPVVVRQARDARHTWIYAVNDAPWPVELRLRLALPAGVAVELLAPAAGSLDNSGQAPWSVALRPFDVWAVRIESNQAAVLDAAVGMSEEASIALRQQVGELRDRVSSLAHTAPLAAPTNAGFESPLSSDGGVAGWRLASATGGRLRLDSTERHGGQQSLVVASDGPPVSLLSDPIEAPATGRCTMTVWLRYGDEPPSIRLALQGTLHGGDYYRFAALGQGQENPLKPGWATYKFRVDDLPLEGLADLRARVDLLSAGELWIDDVEISCLAFTEKEQRELQLLVYSAFERLEQGQWRDCQQILDGYWPKFLARHVPVVEPRVAREPARWRDAPPHRTEPPPRAETPPPRAASDSPGVLETLRTRLNPFKWR